MATTTSTTSSVESTNWLGAVPVVLSLAPTSLSSPTLPPPLHKMVSRQSYLHSALEKEVRRLYKFAPMILSLPSVVRTEPVPEDTSLEEDNDEGKEEKEQKRQQQKDDNDENTHKYPVCWFEDEETGMPLRWHLFVGVLYDLTSRGDGSRSIPWKLRLHFNNYPSSQILPLEDDVVLKLVERTYKNSLKQALFLQNGSSKVAMNLSKQSHQKIWDSILTSKHQLYQQVNNDLLNTPNNVPVRILVDDQPAIQRPCGSADAESQTVGSLLVDWAPRWFHLVDGVVQAKSEDTCWTIQGLSLPMSAPLMQLWQRLSHPDHFLYIVVRTSGS